MRKWRYGFDFRLRKFVNWPFDGGVPEEYCTIVPNSNELELILSQMAQKPMLRGEVGARALRVRSDVRGHG